jgi:hypothetical protein
LTLKYLYINKKEVMRTKTKRNRAFSIDRNLDNIMNEQIKNKSKYIEWLIYQDLKKLDDERIKKIII